jgi:hypothetical protein
MTREDAKRYDELLERERQCLAMASKAIESGSSVGAREWFDAADAARRLAQRIKGPRSA